jgi:eukaryotic-like serine/threonine-protein kinase
MNPGDLLRNRYRIEQALAAGGFGETYLAIDLDYPGQRQVVVKHLKPAKSDPQTLEIARRLFESEAKVLAELGETSDRLPALYAYFEEQDEFYLVLEFVVGQTLAKELGAGKLSEAQTIEILQEILASLAVLHRKNKIHRDLKPANIIRRTSDQKLVLIDFGAVKEVRQVTNLANPLSMSIGIGTQGYMPTEQAIGFPRLASDVYAVGAIGIQCLTGQHPHGLFDESVLALRWQHLCQVSPGLAAMLEKMLAQQPSERYVDAMEAGVAIASLVPKVSGQLLASPQAPSLAITSLTPLSQLASPPPTISGIPAVNVTTPASIPTNNLGSDNGGRRKLLKFLGFGGSGLIGTLLLSQFLPKGSKNNKISFASVRLDNTGKTLEKPAGSAVVFKEDLGSGIFLTMVQIPAGKFMMGSPVSEKERYGEESPQHLVTLPEFYMGQTLVTQAQWQALMGNNPANFKGDRNLPVDSVNWLDAMDFCQKLSQKNGRIYRLPSEAEWEYACRAGTTTPFSFGETVTPAVVNYDGIKPYANAPQGEFRQKTTPVSSFPANLFGLYDMHGNLWEWCLDEWQNHYKNASMDGSPSGNIQSRSGNAQRLLRGSSWNGNARTCRSANRNYAAASLRYSTFGLRVMTSRNS